MPSGELGARAIAHDLTDCVRRGVSGEFICASPATEIHVHLQAGRIAWATDSRHAFVFTRHLQEHAKVGEEQFREVLKACRREHLPLGETLIGWKLATLAQVRAALHFQISCALDELARLRGGQRVFLERTRGYQEYASELTFDLADFGEQLTAGTNVVEPPAHGLMRQIREAVSDVGWIELLDGARVTDQDPPGLDGRVPIPVLEVTLLDGAELVTLRATRGTLVGVSLQNGRTLWCRLAVDSTFGTAVSALSTVAGVDVTKTTTWRPPPHRSGPWNVGSRQSSVNRELTEFLERAPELVATMVKTPFGPEPIRGVGQERVPSDWCKDIVRRRSAVFEMARDIFPEEPKTGVTDLESLGFSFKSLATAEADYWCFGAELSALPGASVWVFIERRGSQGLGWAYLSALQRRLDALRDETTMSELQTSTNHQENQEWQM